MKEMCLQESFPSSCKQKMFLIQRHITAYSWMATCAKKKMLQACNSTGTKLTT